MMSGRPSHNSPPNLQNGASASVIAPTRAQDEKHAQASLNAEPLSCTYCWHVETPVLAAQPPDSQTLPAQSPLCKAIRSVMIARGTT